MTQSLHGLAKHVGDAHQVANVGTLVSAVGRLVASVLPASVTLRLDLEPDLPPIRVASSQIQHALLNLSLNARDAMPAGGRITLGARVRGEGDARSLELFVSDTGSGMEHEVAARVFEPFFSTKPAGQGTGLGLAMVAKAAKAAHDHRGEVRVDSAPGRGTTFAIVLPLDRSADPAPIPRVSVATPTTGRRVIVVDDDPAVRQLLEHVFVSRGWEVALAVDGVEALGRVRDEGPFHAVVTDLQMPRLGGLELAGELHEEWPHLPVVLMSGDVQRSEPELASARSVFEKPLDAVRLVDHVESLVEGARGTPAT